MERLGSSTFYLRRRHKKKKKKLVYQILSELATFFRKYDQNLWLSLYSVFMRLVTA